MSSLSPERARARNLPEGLSVADLLGLYRKMQLIRRFELVARDVFRKGELPGFIHLYVGQEATGVGACAHLRHDDWITSTHRGHGHALAKGTSARAVMAELYGKATGCCGGRGGTMHLYDPSVGLFGTNGIVAGGIASAVGAGMSATLRGTDQVSVAFFGDGAINHGGFHESINLAAIKRAATIFLCENNLYATATSLSDVTLNTDIASRGAAYGVPGVSVDGNDVLAVWQVMREAVERARKGEGPTLVEALTYRTVGHHEGDPIVGTYRQQAEVDAWLDRCPIRLFRTRLTEEFAIATAADIESIDAEVEAEIEDAVAFSRNSPDPDPQSVYTNVFADPINPPQALVYENAAGSTKLTSWLDAVRDGIAEEMRVNPHIQYFGQGTGKRGGTFAHTKNLWDEFGDNRLIDVPISEQGFTGAALGASATGARTIADLMFVDFLFEAAGQIALQAAKLRYMSNGSMSAPMVVRVGAGMVKSAGPHHSGTYHPIWAHIPGLVVCLPSNPADAKGLMKTALRASDPVLMLECKALFSTKGEVPEGEHFVPFGKARIARTGTDLTIATAGNLVIPSLEAAARLAEEGISLEVIDLRTIQPLDVETVVESVGRTHKLLVADEGYSGFGLGAELGQAVMELAFDELDAPVGRLHTGPTTHPFSPALEAAIRVDVAAIVEAVRQTLAGSPHPAFRVASRPGAGPVKPPESDDSEAAEKRSDVPAAAPQPATPAPSEPEGEPVIMPHGDLTVTEGKLVKWYKAPGDAVNEGEHVADIETDKAVVEIEAPKAGTLSAFLHQEGDVVAMGAAIAHVVGS